MDHCWVTVDIHGVQAFHRRPPRHRQDSPGREASQVTKDLSLLHPRTSCAVGAALEIPRNQFILRSLAQAKRIFPWLALDAFIRREISLPDSPDRSSRITRSFLVEKLGERGRHREPLCVFSLFSFPLIFERRSLSRVTCCQLPATSVIVSPCE